MKTISLLLIISLYINGVVTDESLSVMEGDSVTLHTDITDTQRDDLIEWRFGDQQDLIARINGDATSLRIYDDVLDGRFRNRLQVNTETGDLTITNITKNHTGDYKLYREKRTTKTFNISVVTEESVSVYEGDSVTLHTNTVMHINDVIDWRFGHQENLIARINGGANMISIYADVLDGRFRDRLQVNNQTGDLTITNITTQHTGVYRLEIINKETTRKTFIFSVFGYRDKVKKVTVGDSVILVNNVTKKPGDEKMMWRIQHNNSPVAEIIRNGKEAIDEVYNERFRDRLQVDDQTGDLNITNIKPDDPGSYEVDITVGRHIYTIHRSFSVSVIDSGSRSRAVATAVIIVVVLVLAVALAVILFKRCSRNEDRDNERAAAAAAADGGGGADDDDDDGGGAAAADDDDGNVEVLRVNEEESVNLKTEVTDIQRDDVIEWRFRETLIAKINPANNIFSTYDGDDDQFRDKLQIDNQTGDLTINDIRHEHAGIYILKIIRDGETSDKRFKVSVKEEMEPVSVIEGASATPSREDPVEKREDHPVEIEMSLLPKSSQ